MSLNQKAVKTLAILLGLLCLCSCKLPPKPSPSTSQNDVSLNPPGEFPVCKDRITLTVGIAADKTVEDFETNKYTRYLEEKMNADLEFEVYDTNNLSKTIELMMSTGGKNLPDIIIADNLDDFDMLSYGKEGYILPLNDYYQKSSYYLKKIMEEDKNFLSMITMADGNIYCVPKYTKILQNEYGVKLWIYKPFLEELGLDFPRTTEDFYNLLYAIKHQDPNGNGICDELPLLGKGSVRSVSSGFVDFIMSAFIYADAEDYYLYPEDGKIQFACVDDRWKQGLKYMRRLCSEGLLIPSTFTTTDEQYKNLINKKETIVDMSPAFDDANFSKMHRYKVAEPLEGPDGEKNAVYWASKPKNNFFITKNCKYPEAAFRLGDLMCDEYSAIINRWGIEGSDWLKAGNEDISVAFDEGYPALIVPKLEWGAKQNSHWHGAGPGYRDYDVGLGVAVDAFKPMDYEIARSSFNYQRYRPREYIVKLVYDMEEYDEIADIRKAVLSYVSKSTIDFITGVRDIDSNWEEYVSTLNSLGTDRLISITQTAYDRIQK